ncbi:hypothetical protein FJK98_17280 [Micromonospora sp. HM134]|uniref:hypothetical protein n=1 Tax=unclassified Micromonospora TaxID=2617518 RepID=UPI00119896FE|nr:MULTISPECIES: hypothetical protein [unclassified Micromonospora]QDY08678.1 hypothetical protein FJK98_17280 [Micromonospora sp. HM134]
MGEVLPMPSFGDLFTDVRGDERTMRVSYHPERGAVVLSLWSGTTCRGSFRMAVDDVSRLRTVLAEVEASLTPTTVLPAVPPVSRPPAPTGAPTRVAPRPPAVDQTGDISGTAHRGMLPVPRVA